MKLVPTFDEWLKSHPQDTGARRFELVKAIIGPLIASRAIERHIQQRGPTADLPALVARVACEIADETIEELERGGGE